MFITTLVQVNKNVRASVSPFQRYTGILEILLTDSGFR